MARLRRYATELEAAIDSATDALEAGNPVKAFRILAPLAREPEEDPAASERPNPKCYGCGKRIGYTGKWYCPTCEAKAKNAPDASEAGPAAPAPSADSQATPGETAESKGGERQGEEKRRDPEERLRRRRNIAAGYYDEDGIFHPIRASYDYDPSRVGEKRRRRTRAGRRRRRR